MFHKQIWKHWPWLRISGTYRDLHQGWQFWRGWQFSGAIPDAWYFYSCLVWHRHNVIKIPTLPPTWQEWDAKLLHGMMAIFCDYFENGGEHWTVETLQAELEKPAVDEDDFTAAWCRETLPLAQEREALYRWWKIERPARLAFEEAARTEWSEEFHALGGMRFEPACYGVSRAIIAHSPALDLLRERLNQLEEDGDADDEAMLIRLVKIRLTLWT